MLRGCRERLRMQLESLETYSWLLAVKGGHGPPSYIINFFTASHSRLSASDMDFHQSRKSAPCRSLQVPLGSSG